MDFALLKIFPDELEDEWNALLDRTASHVPFLRYEYLRAWWKTMGGGEWQDGDLMLITARQDDKLVGAAPLFLSNAKGVEALYLVGSIEVSDYLDLLASPEDMPEFCHGLLSFLNYAELPHWQQLDLYNILDSSPTLPALKEAAQSLDWQYEEQILQHSPYIPLPGNFEAYLAGIDKKQRHEIRRKMRRAQASSVPVSWYLVKDADLLDREVEAFMDLMSFDSEKAAFLTPPMREHFKIIARCAFEKDCLHMAFLTIGGEKAAAYLGFNYLNKLWVYNSGINPRFHEYSPGWVLLAYQIRWACENQIDELDFMRGDETYKYRFGAVDRFVMRAQIKRPV